MLHRVMLHRVMLWKSTACDVGGAGETPGRVGGGAVMDSAAESETETRPNALFSQESTAVSCFQTRVSLQSSQLTPGWLPIGRKLELTGREPGSSILKAAPLTDYT